MKKRLVSRTRFQLSQPIMFKQLILSVFFCCFAASVVHGQEDPALFTVDGKPVPLSEFRYIYSKTNQDKADFSEKSLRDYLELYTNFKLKVRKARDMQLDTVSATQSELDGYRRQLAKSYLEDKEVTEKLVREAYDRMLQDVDISHIFIACDRNAKAADTLRAYKRATAWLTKIKGGVPFEVMALDSSEDKSAKENKGNLGYITAMLPDGYYAMEKAIYSTRAGTINTMPVRSNAGYHLIKVNAMRPARGEVEVSQILLRKTPDNATKTAQAKMRADSLCGALRSNPAAWDEVCSKFSEDKQTAPKGGYIGFFGINRYQRAFEDASFSLEKDGDIYPSIVETSIGYHIIKRMSRRPVLPFETMKKALNDRVKRDSRSEIARQSMISRIQRDGSFQQFPPAFEQWLARQQDTVFLTFRWKPDPAKPQTPLMQYGKDKVFTVADFEEYCARASRERMRGSGYPLSETAQKLYKSWSDDVALQFEESQLDKKYPEFRSLMREYEEGILLFEALKINVWDRANTDSVGLEQYFAKNLADKYKWDERAHISIYTLKTDDPEVLEKLRKLAAKKPAAEVVKKMNKKKDLVTVIEKNYEKGKNKDLGTLWTAGAMTDAKTDAGTKTASFLKIEQILPPTSKTLSEARGYAVADYQDYLEKQWISDLRKAYTVKVDEQVLKSLIR